MARPFNTDLKRRIARNMRAFSRRGIVLEGRRAAAVAVIVTPDEHDRACYVITRRALSLRAHPGQLALPGGRIDDGESAVQAALRETREEIGISLGDDAVLGTLDDYATRSGYVMSPIVMWAENDGEFAPNPAEVERVYKIPLDSMDPPDVPHLIEIAESDRPVIQLPLGNSDGHALHTLNAPTAAVVYQLYEVGVCGRDTRVAHFEQPVWAWK